LLNHHLKKDNSFQTLVNLGTQGFLPLFEGLLTSDMSEKENSALTVAEKKKANKLIDRVIKHRTLERQKTVVFAMDEVDRKLLIRAFIKIVEGKILDNEPQLQ
jgi:hypothetical protein